MSEQDSFFKRLGDEFLLFVKSIRVFLFETSIDDWMARLLFLAAAGLLIFITVMVKGCIDKDNQKNKLQMEACSQVGMFYLDHTQHGISCIDKNRNIVVIETQKNERKPEISVVPFK